MEELEELREDENTAFERESQGNGSQIFSEPFSHNAVGRLKHLVNTFHEQGKNQYYTIHVDGVRVVGKTADGRKFDNYIQFVNNYSKLVEVRLYQGKSFNCNKYRFIISSTLSGIEGEKTEQERINSAIAAHKRELEFKSIQQELEGSKKKLKKLKKLQKESESEESGFNFDNVTSLVQNAVGLVGQLRGGAVPIAGVGQTIQPEAEVEIESVDDNSNSESKGKPKVGKKARKLYEQLALQLSADEMIDLIHMVKEMSNYPEVYQKYRQEIELLIKNNQNGQA
ncbi:MAG: hypothetical protein GQ574_26780 [Crocinitomix sp.]|nr:hypothetical protein [Crocinitomix sp.]